MLLTCWPLLCRRPVCGAKSTESEGRGKGVAEKSSPLKKKASQLSEAKTPSPAKKPKKPVPLPGAVHVKDLKASALDCDEIDAALEAVKA